MKLAVTCLQVDFGNSAAKWRLLKDGTVVGRGRFLGIDDPDFALLLSCTENVNQIWVSSVAAAERNAPLAAALETRWGVKVWFAKTVARAGNLVNSYAEPERMGVDRWLAMLGARSRMHGRFAVVDAGSALTVDIVSASGRHEGGYIIPGAQLMERALLLDTDRVRFEESIDYALHPGCSTAEAVRHGIAAAQAGAVELIRQTQQISPEQLLFCGGAAPVLMQLMAIDALNAPDLVFEGLEVLAGEEA